MYSSKEIKGWIKTVLQRENGLGDSHGQCVPFGNVRIRPATQTLVRNKIMNICQDRGLKGAVWRYGARVGPQASR